jgi:lincosamide nucleotidyltransferase A/C/D/E
MSKHVMTAKSALRLLEAMSGQGVQTCVGGGWAVDALLREQTREHSDLDLWVAAFDAEPLFVALTHVGVDRIFPWPGDRPWNFVVHDGGLLRVDLHFYERTSDDTLHYGAFDAGEFFPAAALAAPGTIGGVSVRCEAPEWTLRWHSGYPIRDVDRHDVSLLCERFALALPEAYRAMAAEE